MRSEPHRRRLSRHDTAGAYNGREQVIGDGGPEDEDRYRTNAQREWARWAASGYAKRWQPRSILWFGAVFTLIMVVALFTVFWLAAHGRL